MIELKSNYKNFYKVEDSLNNIKFEKIELGVIFSFYIDRLYVGDFETGFFRNLKFLILYLAKSLIRLNSIEDYRKKIIYFNRGSHRHYQELVNAVLLDPEIKKQTIIIGPQGASNLCQREVFFLSNLIDFFKIISFLIFNRKAIMGSFSPIKLKFSVKVVVFLKLILQLLKTMSIKKFIEKQTLTDLIASDADRGKHSSLFYAIARAYKIKNFTFQHGVVNGHFGYYPLNADEVWVWGNMAKNQFLDMGASLNDIRVTGTPIVKEIKVNLESKLLSLKKYKMKKGRTIALALSTPCKINDLELVKFFANLKTIYGNSNDNFIVKIHPARDFSLYSWIEKDFGIKLLPHNVLYEDFMNMVDIVLAHTSGIATEALFYDKIVGILDILKKYPGNGLMLNRYFDIPLLKSTLDFEKLVKSNVNTEEIYYRTGTLASIEISKSIKKKLSLND